MIRIEVFDQAAGCGVIRHVDPGDGTPAQRDGARAVIRRAVSELAERTGQPEGWCRDVLLAVLALRFADIEGYEREAARRGVLPL